MRSWQYALIMLGVFVWAIAVFLMVEGSILGENNTGWAIVIGIVGIGLITTSGVRLGKLKKS